MRRARGFDGARMLTNGGGDAGESAFGRAVAGVLQAQCSSGQDQPSTSGIAASLKKSTAAFNATHSMKSSSARLWAVKIASHCGSEACIGLTMMTSCEASSKVPME
jgi:hypothetical protein